MFNTGTSRTIIRKVLRFALGARRDGCIVIGPSYLASAFGIPKSSAHNVLKKAAEMGYGTYDRGKGFVMNERGVREAERSLRRHRLLECLLEDIGVSKDDVCDEAARIDEFIGEKFEKVLEDRYGNRKFCPCGKEIPQVVK